MGRLPLFLVAACGLQSNHIARKLRGANSYFLSQGFEKWLNGGCLVGPGLWSLPTKNPFGASQVADVEPQQGVQPAATQCYTPGRLQGRIVWAETERRPKCFEAMSWAAYCVQRT